MTRIRTALVDTDGRPPSAPIHSNSEPTLNKGTQPRDVPLSIDATFQKLDAYCRKNDWAGFDPYDALNSPLFARTLFLRSRIARIAFTQALKRSPINFRPWLGIQAQHDPKATALFVSSYVNSARRGDRNARESAGYLVDRLLELRSPAMSYACWGYSFPWQTRSRLVPRFAPNLVTTVFAATALLDAYELGLGGECLDAAASAGEYLARELYWSEGERAGFGYPFPDVRVPIHNANLLGAALVCRLARLTGARSGVPAALSVTRFSVLSQREDGSWPYGLSSTQDWIDHFHTGYNLCALHSIGNDLHTDEFEPALLKGLTFYRRHFFTADGAPKYFHNRTYPIDIHCVAQSLITLTAFKRLDPPLEVLAESVLAWAMEHMWDERGFFYYRVLRGLTIRTSFMRWSQAWMLLALSLLSIRAPNPCDRLNTVVA